MLVLYDSLTRTVEPFEPIEDNVVKMFTCGPSIYQRPHIGNYRTFLFEDVLQRYLEYLGHRVIRTFNITDIEEKSIREAHKREMDVLVMTQKLTDAFSEEMKLLKIKPPTYNPKSSTSVEQAVKLTEELLKRGHAYWYKGNVYFDPLTLEVYGRLARIDKSKLQGKKRRYHRDTYNFLTGWNTGDFILWHGYRKGDAIYWDTSLGRGRPAWNMQDAAMVTATLGFSIDIFCGGIDNLARHHDNVNAIAESISGKMLARYWLHCAHLFVNGKKMSKSKGNIIYTDELLKAGYSGEEIRFFLIYGHYRERLNFTDDKFKEASLKLKRACEMIDAFRHVKGLQKSCDEVKGLIEHLKLDFEKNMDNDLDVKKAFDGVFDNLTQLAGLLRENRVSTEDAGRIIDTLISMDNVLQVFKQKLT